MIESIEKLREWSHRDDCRWLTEDGKIVMTTSSCAVPVDGVNVGQALRDLADEIEHEIAEKYMALPLDADGVPIRVGDVLECHANGFSGTFSVFTVGDGVAVGNHDIGWIMDNPTGWYHVAKFCRHVKPRTIEDVLSEFADSVQNSGHQWGLDAADVVPKYAEEIRELFGVAE